MKNVVQSFWYVVCCKFLKSGKTDYHNSQVPLHSMNYRATDTINLLDISASQSIDIMLKPQ